MLWLLLAMSGATAFSVNYRKAFGSQWTAAQRFVDEHHQSWQPVFSLFGVDARLAEAIVFPEIIRYSMWQDEIERAAVGGLYVAGGKEKANFSIGCFQMKPSFAEQVEREWNQSPLAAEFGFAFNLADNAEARRSRVRRLSTEEGQCRYLAIFVRLQHLRHPQLQTLAPPEQVRYLATVYNRSYTATWQQILSMQHERHYHTDVINTRHTRLYCYADIAVSAYLQGRAHRSVSGGYPWLETETLRFRQYLGVQSFRFHACTARSRIASTWC